MVWGDYILDVIDVIDEAYKEFLSMIEDTHGKKNTCKIPGVSYVTVFVNYLKGKIEDEYSDDRK